MLLTSSVKPLAGPLKIFQDGRIRKDLEATYLRNSRLPEHLALDLRAKMAAVQVISPDYKPRLTEFGAGVVLSAMDDVIDYTERRLRARLRRATRWRLASPRLYRTQRPNIRVSSHDDEGRRSSWL